MWFANALTAIRLLLAIPFAYAISYPNWIDSGWTALMIGAALFSDYLDGPVARATNSASPAGMIFDHGTDFFFVTTALASAAHSGFITPFLWPLIIIAFSQYVLDSRFLFKQKTLRMSFLGRWNGVLYFLPLVLIVASRLTGFENYSEALKSTAYYCGLVLLVTTFVSILDRAAAPLREKI